MKLVYLSRSVIPSTYANSIQVMKMCEAFTKSGFDVTLLAHCSTVNLSEIFNFYNIKYPFTIKHIPLSKDNKTNISFVLKSVKEILKIKPHIVYGRFLEACLLSAMLKYNTLYEAHKLPKKPISIFSARLLFNLSHFRRLIVITRTLSEMFKTKYKLKTQKIVVAHDGADPPELNPSGCVPEFAQKDLLQVGYIGNLYPGKGMELIIKLVHLAPWAMFHIVGGSKGDINYWQSKIGNSQNIKFYGFVPPAELQPFRKLFDVALLPSQPEVRNNFNKIDTGDNISPLKLFEYMAAGLPVLASDLPSIREVLENEKNALLLPPDDEKAWVNALKVLKDNQKKRKQLGENARKLFMENFTWEARARKIMASLTLV